ncbi:MAG: hypothetical protein V6Z81_06520 [Parvularculales bacterium]
MSVRIKRVPQVLSGDNFPAADPEDGTYFVFNVAQTSFISGKTIRNDEDTAAVTSASEGDMFKYFTSGTKWVRQYEKRPGRTDEEIQAVVGGVVQRHANGSIDPDYDDASNALTLSLSEQTTLGTWQSRAAGVSLSDGEVEINGANNQIVVRLTDYAGNDKTTELGTVAVGDQIHIDSGTDDLYLRITGIASTATAYTFSTRLLPGSTAYADFIVNGTDTLYLRKPVDYTKRSDEDIRDVTAAQLTAGTNISITEDDAGNTLSITATDTNTQRSDEDIRDVVAAQLTPGNGIALTEDDAGDTLAVGTQDWEWLYGSSTTLNTTTGATQINITAGTSFDDYRELMFIGVHETNGREFSMVFAIASFNSNSDDVQPNNGHAYLVVRRTGSSTFQFHHKGNEGCLRAILGKR